MDKLGTVRTQTLQVTCILFWQLKGIKTQDYQRMKTKREFANGVVSSSAFFVLIPAVRI